MTDIMKAITVYQPYASFLAYLIKLYETRPKAISYRGPIAIHAAVKPVSTVFHEYGINIHSCPEIYRIAKEHLPCKLDALPLGCVIATAELVDCVEIYKRGDKHGNIPLEYADQTWLDYSRGDGWRDDRQVIGDELVLGDWTPGRYAWEFANMKLLPEPIPVRGQQGLWNWRKPA